MPTATSIPTATPTFTPTPRPTDTPTVTPTPDTVGPSISALSIGPEFEAGRSVYADPRLNVRCAVVDASGVQQVILRYWFTPYEGQAEQGTVPMTPADNLYAGSFGPLGQEGTLRYRVEARDRAGNASESSIEMRDVVYAVDY
jgi:hypothetical protein